MSLPLATLKELQKLSALEAKGGILARQYELIKNHVREGNSLMNEDWQAFDLAWELRSNGVFSEEEWTTQVDGDKSSGQIDELSLAHDDDSIESADEIHGMEIPDGFALFKHLHRQLLTACLLGWAWNGLGG